jgi:hypothetical protein
MIGAARQTWTRFDRSFASLYKKRMRNRMDSNDR